MTDIEISQDISEADAEKVIHDALNAYVIQTGQQIVESTKAYGDTDEQRVVLAISVLESVATVVLLRLPIKPGTEGKLLAQMRKRVMDRLANGRLMAGKAQGNA